MNNMKAKRKLRGYWINKNMLKWIEMKYRMKLYPEDMNKANFIFVVDMNAWNGRFTHEETINKNYEGWNPYCCCEHCKDNDRMERTEFGWRCNTCLTQVGKHLYYIGNLRFLGYGNEFNKQQGRPYTKIEGYRPNGI